MTKHKRHQQATIRDSLEQSVLRSRRIIMLAKLNGGYHVLPDGRKVPVATKKAAD